MKNYNDKSRQVLNNSKNVRVMFYTNKPNYIKQGPLSLFY